MSPFHRQGTALPRSNCIRLTQVKPLDDRLQLRVRYALRNQMMKSDLVIFIIARVKRLIWLRQLGLLNHWANSFLPRPYRCSAPLASLRPTSNERLTLNYLSSAFLLYGVGVGVSILAFVLEVISTWWNATTRVKSFGSRHSRINA